MKKTVTCTICPKGCEIEVSLNSVTGYSCDRGKEYATAEVTNPVRILTTTVRVTGGAAKLLPVRSKGPIPKGLLFKAMEECSRKEVDLGVKMGDVIIPNIAGSGIDMVACCDAMI